MSEKTTEAMTFEVGQELCFVRSDNRRTRQTVKVVKVGRVWVTLSVSGAHGLRIALDDRTLVVVDPKGSRVGRCFMSEADYENARKVSVEWSNLCKIVSVWTLPNGMTLEKIAKIRELVEGA